MLSFPYFFTYNRSTKKYPSHYRQGYAELFAEFFYICWRPHTMATTHFYLDLRGKAKDGKGSVLIILSHNESTTSFRTGIRLFPQNWSRQHVVKMPEADILNASLLEQKAKIDKSIALLSVDDKFDLMTASQIKKALSPETESHRKGHLVIDLIDEYVRMNDLRGGTRELYDSTRKKVISFCGKAVRIEDLNYKWVKSFNAFLAETQGVNGRAIYLRCLRAVCNYAKHSGIRFQYPFDTFRIKTEETKKRSLTIEQLRELLHFPVEGKQIVARDFFFLIFYLIGINVVDLLLAKKEQVVNGRLEYIRGKTHKKYSVKIEPEAEQLLKKYEGSGDYLLNVMDHCLHYKSFSRQINEGLQSIGTKEMQSVPGEDLFSDDMTDEVFHPLIPGLTTYYARHSWATLAYEIGIPIDIISQALGHSFGNRTTLIYIKSDPAKVDEANRQVIDYLLSV